MSDIKETYYEKRLPDLIGRLKSQFKKNLIIINRVVESNIGEDKYFNVLKGRKMAAEHCIKTLKQIDELESNSLDKSYFKEQLPLLIEHLKKMFDINLDVVDIDIDEDDFGDDLKKLSEDKYHQVLRARETASLDNEWVLRKIDELENELKGKEIEKKPTGAEKYARR